MDSMLCHFENVLRSSIRDPSAAMSDFEMLNAAEGSELEGWNSTAIEFQEIHVLHKLIESQVERTPLAVAVIYETQSLTYFVLNHRANRLAHELSSRGAGPENPVAVLIDPCLEMVISLLAILKAGAAYIPITPEEEIDRELPILNGPPSPLILTNTTIPSHF